MKALLFHLFFTVVADTFAQKIVYQNIFRGAVSVNAVNSTESSSVQLISGLQVKKAMLVAGNQNDNFLPTSPFFEKKTMVNGIEFIWSKNSQVTPRVQNSYLLFSSSVHMIDVTSAIISGLVLIENTPMFFPSFENMNQRFYCMALVVIYEDDSLPEIAFSMWLNDKEIQVPQSHVYEPINAINNLNPVALSLMTGHLINIVSDGSNIKINNNDLGNIGQNFIKEENGDNFAPIGQFRYSNAIINALFDDNEDLQMFGNDALSNIESIVGMNDTSIIGEYVRVVNTGLGLEQTNLFWATFLAYTTTCDTFTVQTSNDTTVCFGSELQLNASGGVKYLWSPSVGLSCDTCPNPVFTADSTVFYTVRVWNNDSCSVVRPVHVIVKNERGKAPDVSVSPTFCGDSTGVATASVSPSGNVVSWQTVGGTPQSSPILQNLAPGFHTIFYTDNNGCQSLDTTIFIPTVNPFTVSFVANPPNGAAPLSVDFVNTSVSANNFEWFINGQFVGNSLTNFVFDTIGLYTVSLVGWQNNVLCIDTVSVQIFVFDSLIVTLPNVFTPNGDGVNELLTITTNQDVTYEFSIQNRWGNTMLTGTGNLQKSIPQPIWDGNEASDGVYFVLLKFTQIDGKEIKAQGFVQVFGR